MRRILWAAVVVAVVAVALVALVWRPSIAPAEPLARSAFDLKLVQRGAQLAAIGDCAGCHSVADGRSYAGGVALKTPFGTIFGTNLTPDPETGIGSWPRTAFYRAMREGISRDGRHLYPAFPYNHFTRLSDQDLEALYAFLMTRDPVTAAPPPNEVKFPFNIRALVAGWNLLFLDKTAYRPDPAQSAQWNRGAYLVESLGHCGACHTPRNALGAEKKNESFSGGEAEGWYVPALNQHSPSPLPWTLEELTVYLRTGLVERHAIAGGPMQGVVYGLSQAPDEDVAAIATYIHSLMGPLTPDREARAKASLERAARPLAGSQPQNPGAPVYAGNCASCHDAGREISSAGALRLPAAIALYDPDPASLIRIILEGITPPEGERGRWMPAFAGALTDEQLVALVNYLRDAAGQLPWRDVAGAVKKAKNG